MVVVLGCWDVVVDVTAPGGSGINRVFGLRY